MKLPLSWLSDYTDISGVTPKEYDARLTMSGSKVDARDRRTRRRLVETARRRREECFQSR